MTEKKFTGLEINKKDNSLHLYHWRGKYLNKYEAYDLKNRLKNKGYKTKVVKSHISPLGVQLYNVYFKFEIHKIGRNNKLKVIKLYKSKKDLFL